MIKGNLIYKVVAQCETEFNINQFERKSPDDVPTFNLTLTPGDYIKFNNALREMINDTFIMNTGVDVNTETVSFTSLVMPFHARLDVINSKGIKSTATYKNKTICIDTH